MKIIIALYKYFYWGGLQKDTVRLIEEAISRGHQVTVFTTDWPDPPAGVTIEKIRPKGWTNVARMKHFTSDWLERLKKRDYDVSVAMNRIPGADFYFVADTCMASCYRQKHSSLMLKLNPRYRYILENERTVVGPGSHTVIMCIAQKQWDEFKREYNTPDERMFMLPPGMNPACVYPGDEKAADTKAKVRQEFGIGPDDFVIISVGTSWGCKGIDRTAAAIAALPIEKRRQLHWLLVGENTRDNLAVKLQKFGLTGILHLTGPRHDVNRLLLASDLMVHPAREEGAGTVLIEAIASHVPVICTAICGFYNYVAESGGIVIAEPFDQAKLNAAMQNAMENCGALAASVEKYAGTQDFTARASVFVAQMEKIAQN